MKDAPDPLVNEAEGLRADVQRLSLTVRILVWVVCVQSVLVAALGGLTVFLFVTSGDVKATLATGTTTLGILEGCLSPGDRLPTLDDPRTGNPCFDQITSGSVRRTADTRLSIDCAALWQVGQLRSAMGLPANPLSPSCAPVVARIEALRP